MGYDLHVHSIYSDGTLSPRELVEKAILRELDGFALTDHDTLEGLSEALQAAEEANFTLIPGIEFTTDLGQSEVHILGYDFDLHNSALIKKIAVIIESRIARARAMVLKLQRHGIALAWEQVCKLTTSKFVGRYHIFQALLAEKLINPALAQKSFHHYLGKHGLAYVPHQEIDTVEAIQLINDAGGIAVLAHPGRMENDHLIYQLVEAGLGGLEAYYPTHPPKMIEHYLKLSAELGLMVTGGSDYHGGRGQNRLGEAQISQLPFALKYQL